MKQETFSMLATGKKEKSQKISVSDKSGSSFKEDFWKSANFFMQMIVKNW